MNDYDLEDFLAQLYIPIKSIENITNIIYYQINENWDFLKPEIREQGEELLSLNYTIKLLAKNLLKKRQNYLDLISNDK